MFEPLNKNHHRENFDCGDEFINRYLKTMANQHTKKGIAKVYVYAQNDNILAYYTLNSTELDNSNALKGYPNKIPAVLIGRMGVDDTAKGQGLSKIAIAHALQMAKKASDIIGIAFIVIDAKTDELVGYYQKFGFILLADKRLIYPMSQL